MMLKNSYIGLFIIILLCTNSFAGNEFKFRDWEIKDNKRFVNEIKEEKGTVDKNIKETLKALNKQIDNAKLTKNYRALLFNLRQKVAVQINNLETWCEWGLACFESYNLKQLKGNDTWKEGETLRKIGRYLYINSKDIDTKIKGLLFAGFGSWGDNQAAIIKALSNMANMQEWRQKHPEFKHILAFSYKEFSIDNNQIPPQICFKFNQDLQDVTWSDYIIITPKVDGAFKKTGQEVCINGLIPGQHHEAIIKAGLKSTGGEILEQDHKLSFIAQDQEPRLSFTEGAYILPMQEQKYIPLTAVNVDSIHVKVAYINDRNVSNQIRNLIKDARYDFDDITRRAGELVFDGVIDIKNHDSNTRNKSITKNIDWSQLVPTPKTGIYLIQAIQKGALNKWNASQATQWVLVTDLGISTFLGQNDLLVNVRSMANATSVVGVEVQLIARNNEILAKATTNKKGIVTFNSNLLKGKGGKKAANLLVYDQKGDFSILKLETPTLDLSDQGVGGRPIIGNNDGYIYTDRGVYRPGEIVNINAILRDHLCVALGKTPLTFKILGPGDKEVAQQVLTGNEQGVYSLPFSLQDHSNTGQWKIEAYVDPKQPNIAEVNFNVEDFTPAKVMVFVNATTHQLSLNQSSQAKIEARYLFGAAAQKLSGEAILSTQRHPNPFPNYETYTFGLVDEDLLTELLAPSPITLDEKGQCDLPVVLNKMPKTTKPVLAKLQVSINDVIGQKQNGFCNFFVSPTDYFLGLKAIEKDGKDNVIHIIALNPNQERISIDKLDYELYEEKPNYSWYQEKHYSTSWSYQLVYTDHFIKKGEITGIDKEKGYDLSLQLPEFSRYRLEVYDLKTGIKSSIRIDKGYGSISSEKPEILKIKSEQKQYKIGEKAKKFIKAPFDGKALLVVGSHNILQTEEINVSSQGSNVEIPVTKDWGVGSYVSVSAVRPLINQKNNNMLPKRAIGICWIGVDNNHKKLPIKLELPESIKPSQIIEVPIKVEIEGKEQVFVTVSAVDEGILSLTDFKTPNPFDHFFGKKSLSLEVRDMYGRIIDHIEGEKAEIRSGGDMGALLRKFASLKRNKTNIVSLYEGQVDLDSKGNGKITLKIPDFNGTLRFMAVAVSQERLGNFEGSLLVHDPLVVDLSTPKFLMVNDKSSIILSLHNLKATEGKYQVKIDNSEGGLESNWSEDIELKKGDTHYFSIPVIAKVAGDGKIIINIKTPDGKTIIKNYNLIIKSPLAPIEKIIMQPLVPQKEWRISVEDLKDFDFQTINCELQISNQIPWAIKKYRQKLQEYSYSCTEPLVSKGFGANNKDTLNQILAILTERQHHDGAFACWDKDVVNPWISIYVLDFYLSLEQKQEKVPTFAKEKLNQWVLNFINNQKNSNDEEQLKSVAYGIWVLIRSNQLEGGAPRYYFDTSFDKLPLVGKAYIAASLFYIGDKERGDKAFQALADNMSKINNLNDLVEITNALSIVFKNDPAKMQPFLERINAAIIANDHILSAYTMATLLRISENLVSNTSNSNVNCIVNDKEIKEFPHHINTKDLQKLVIKNGGKEEIWQNLIFTGLSNKPLPEVSKGIKIERSFYQPDGKSLNLKSIKHGETIVVVVKGKVDGEYKRQLLLVDWLPAGLEHGLLPTVNYSWLPERKSLSHYDRRDDRYIAVIELEQEVREFVIAYELQAINLGTYHYPAMTIEEIANPSNFGRSNTMIVNVESIK